MKPLFKKRKMNPGGVVPLVDEDRFPKVIKEPKLKQTTCCGCFAVYQAKARHIRPGVESRERLTTCPICGTYNLVEFETDGEDSGRSGE